MSSEIRNALVAFSLCFVILVGFNYLTERPAPSQNDSGASRTPPAYVNNIPLNAGTSKPLTRAEILKKTPRISLKNTKISGSINVKGALLDDVVLTDYLETPQEKEKFIALLNPATAAEPYFATLTWTASQEKTPLDLPTETTEWTRAPQSAETLEPGKDVILTWKSPQGLTLTRTFSLDDNFMIFITDRVQNDSERDVTLEQHSRIIRSVPSQKQTSSVHEGGLVCFDADFQEITFEKLAKGKSLSGAVSDGWVGFTDKYWLTAFIIKGTQPSTTSLSFNHHFSCQTTSVSIPLKKGDSVEYKNMFFAGAKVLKSLDAYKKQYAIKKFDLAVDFGWFYFLTKPLFLLMRLLNALWGNMALSIVVLTLLSKGVSFPLAQSSYKSMSRMKELQPKIDALKQRYGSDKMKVNEEMLRLYKKEKINPLSGFLPLLIQMPIFFCLYKVLAISIEMRHAPFFWIRDLSSADPTSLFNLFGLLPWTPPHFLQIGLLPLLMTGTMFLQQKLSPQSADPAQKKMMNFLPFVFLFMFSSFPAGLVLYWTLSNSFAIGQQMWGARGKG
ncbi:membrane protein insertase YidC [Alphaproteobacteria bacterium]|nr:membrane protein insertase YidC [Alphaproteobacteria bacterium]